MGISNKHSIQCLGVRLFEIAQASQVCPGSNWSLMVVVRIKHSNAYNVHSTAFTYMTRAQQMVAIISSILIVEVSKCIDGLFL